VEDENNIAFLEAAVKLQKSLQTFNVDSIIVLKLLELIIELPVGNW